MAALKALWNIEQVALRGKISAALGMALCLAACSLISDREMTVSAMRETFFRIHLYARSSGKVPKSLSILPLRDNFLNRIDDAWGRQLIYKVDEASNSLTLSSLGADAEVGGTGEDADITIQYRIKDEKGHFMVLDDLWIVNGEIK